MSTRPPLPQELIDLIVEQLYLADDEKSLTSCLTTSKAFFPAARAGIWRLRSLAPFLVEGIWRQKLLGAPHLLSFIRFLDFDLANGTTWDNFAAVAGVLERITRIYLDLSMNEKRFLTLPVARGWRLTSIEVSLGCLSLTCAFFASFPALRDVTLRECSSDRCSVPTSQCKRACHNMLPQLTALTIEGYIRDAPTLVAILAGHLFPLERLRTLELIDSVDHPQGLISTMPRTLEDLFVDGIESGRSSVFVGFLCLSSLFLDTVKTPEHWDRLNPLTFGPYVPCITFSVDTDKQARETLIWWIKTFRHNFARNSIRQVTIYVQLHLSWNDFYPPRIRFPVWKELARVLTGLGQLRQLTIVYTALYKGRRGWPQEKKKRQSITNFLKKAFIPVTDTGHVQIAFIDRNL